MTHYIPVNDSRATHFFKGAVKHGAARSLSHKDKREKWVCQYLTRKLFWYGKKLKLDEETTVRWMKKSLGYPEDQTNSGPHSAGLLRTQFYLKKKICKAGGVSNPVYPIWCGITSAPPIPRACTQLLGDWGQAGLQERCHTAWLHVRNKHTGPPVSTYNHLRCQVPISGPQKSPLSSIFPSLYAPPHIKHSVLYTVNAQ